MAEIETFTFQAEISQLLSLINTINGNKEIFLIELLKISCNDLRKMLLIDKSKLDPQPNLFIDIIPDKTNNTLTIINSGVGMTKADLVKNLGTIDRSRAKEFMEIMAAGGDASEISHCRFGFFSAYLVAKKVIITTKHNDDEQYVWESQAGVSFTVTRDTSGENLGRGKKITLYLKKRRLKDVINYHPKLPLYSIYIWVGRTIEEEIKEVSATKEGLKFDGSEDEKQKQETLKAKFEGLCKAIKDILGDKVEKVVVSDLVQRLACCLVIGEYSWTANMKKIINAQALKDSRMRGYVLSKKTMVINPENDSMKALSERADADKNSKSFKNEVLSLFDCAHLANGFIPRSPTPSEPGSTVFSPLDQNSKETEYYLFTAMISQFLSLTMNTYSNKEHFLYFLLSNSNYVSFSAIFLVCSCLKIVRFLNFARV